MNPYRAELEAMANRALRKYSLVIGGDACPGAAGSAFEA